MASGSVFQIASFVDADLTDARFECAGDGADFQGVTFRRANLTNAVIRCSGPAAFSTVDLTAANLQGADLRTIDPVNLTSSYFDTPPTYSAATRLPAGFDPVRTGWKLVE